MKIFSTLSAITFAAGAFAPLSIAQENGEYLAVDASEVFVPKGFDDNDEVVVVVDGWLPDGCYRLVRPETVINHETQTITVTPMARWWNIPCVEMLVPYHFEVRLGVLPYGDYKIKVNKTMDVTENLTVLEATNSGPDEFLYAPVEDAAIEKDPQSNNKIGLISGRFTNSCMKLKEVKVNYNDKTMVVLPIAEMDENENCALGVFPFEKKFELPENIKNGRNLMHVRSLNGYDVNVMFDYYKRK